MTEPRDPFLRAIHRVGLAADATPTERLALLALWRFLGRERKAVGPRLLAHLVGTSATGAKWLLYRLQAKGYVKSSGARSTGVVAVRQLTRKVRWPGKGRKSVAGTTYFGGDESVAGTTAKSVAGTSTDQGVRQVRPSRLTRTDTPAGVEKPEEPNGPMLKIADVLAGRGAARG